MDDLVTYAYAPDDHLYLKMSCFLFKQPTLKWNAAPPAFDASDYEIWDCGDSRIILRADFCCDEDLNGMQCDFIGDGVKGVCEEFAKRFGTFTQCYEADGSAASQTLARRLLGNGA